MNTIVVYKHKYGSTDKYAKWIGEELGCPVYEYKSFDKSLIDKSDIIIYGGGVHAGGIRGWDEFRKLVRPYLDSAYYQGLDETEGASITGTFSIKKFLSSYKKNQEKTYQEKEDERQQEVELIRENYHPEKKVVCFCVGINVQSFDARAELRNVNFDARYLRPIPCYYFDGAYDPKKVKGMDKKIIKMLEWVVRDKGLNASDDEKQLLRRVVEGCDLVDKAQIEPLIKEVRSYME